MVFGATFVNLKPILLFKSQEDTLQLDLATSESYKYDLMHDKS